MMPMRGLDQIEQVKAKLKPYLVEYVKKFRPHLKVRHNVQCLNPLHRDSDPSCSVGARGDFFHCFGCGVSGDIFDAAHLLENRPISGPEFLTDNVAYLAEMFGVEMPKIELTEEERRLLDAKRAYAAAAAAITETVRLALAKGKNTPAIEKLEEYGWPEEIRQLYQIGCVVTYAGYVRRMTEIAGFREDFLREIGLLDKAIFSPENLIYTIRDHHGAPVAFAARRLSGNGPKYINSKTGEGGSPLYKKSELLYGLDVARKNAPPVYIFEGYSDVVTAATHGIQNAVALGSSSISREHIDLLLSLRNGRTTGIDHIIFVLDADKAGQNGTERFAEKMQEVIGTQVGLRVEIVEMPEGSDDPDAFIRQNGAEAFRRLERKSLFHWTLARNLKNASHKDAALRNVIGTIILEPSPMNRYQMMSVVSSALSIPLNVIEAEVLYRTDAEAIKIQEEIAATGAKVALQIQKNPAAAADIIRDAARTIERIQEKSSLRSADALIRYYTSIFEAAEAHVQNQELVLGWPLFDTLFGGIPKADAFLTMPGKPNQGKSSVVANMAWRLVDHNPDVVVVVHSVDDSLRWWLPRLFGSRTGIPSRWFFSAGYFLEKNSPVTLPSGERVPFRDVYQQEKSWLRKMILDGRLYLFDISVLDEALPSLEARVAQIRKKHQGQPIVVFCDNFHLYRSGSSREESDHQHIRALSAGFKEMANQNHVTVVATMELPKASLDPGRRPRLSNIKGSAGIAYDSSANIGVYNDLKDLRDAAMLFWEKPVDPEEDLVKKPGYTVLDRRNPILELVFDKSKVNSGFDGNLYYKFDQMSGRVTECSEDEQQVFAKISAEQQAAMSYRSNRSGSPIVYKASSASKAAN